MKNRAKGRNFMRNRALISLVYDRKRKVKVNGKGTIEIYIYFPDKKKQYISTQINLEPRYWNKKNKWIDRSYINYTELDNYLANILNNLEKQQLKLIHRGIMPTLNSLKASVITSNNQTTFNQFCRHQIEIQPLKYNSYRAQRRSLDVFDEFNSNVTFDDLTVELIMLYDKHLKKQGWSDNYIYKCHKDIKKFINIAKRQKLIKVDNDPYLVFKPTRPSPKIEYLNYTELQQLENIEIKEKVNFKLYHDMFLFACYTGLRYTDLHALNYHNFEQRDKGLVIILKRMHKVDTRVFLPLYDLFNGKPQKLIQPYYNANANQKYIWGKYVSNTTLNAALKNFTNNTEIRKNLHVHLARHTFGTLYAHKTGDIFKVMQRMGISTFDTAQVYINLSEEL